MWEKVKIKQISTQIRGVSYKPKDILNENAGNSIKLLRANNITNNGLGKLSDIIYIDSKCTSDQQILRKGDILICASSGSKNLVGKAIGFFSNDIYTFGAFCKIVRPKNNVLPKYLNYYFQSPEYRNTISALSAGANINNIRNEHIDNLEIPLPPLPIQEKIAAILDKADELRRKDQELQDKYDKLAQAMFIDMFGDPVRNEKGWEVKKLLNVCSKIGSGSTPIGGKAAYKKEGISLIRSMNIHQNEFRNKDLAFIDERQANQLRNVIVEEHDVLFNITGASVCRTTIVPPEILPARVNQHVAILRSKKHQLTPQYFVRLLNNHNMNKSLYRMATQGGATREAITKEQLKKIEIPIPPLHLQEAFVKKIELINKLKAKTNTERSEELFQSLLQRAFKGELVSKTQLTE